MSPPPELSPWIEKLILGYDEEAAEPGRGFKAQVLYVDWLSPTQAHLAPGPKDLLYMSDGAVHIPALLTAEAVQHLLDVEERESLSSLHLATVLVRNVKLLFHADAEETRSRFYLSVGTVATQCVGTREDAARSCSELPSVQRKISKVWRGKLGTNPLADADSQSVMELSELLWEYEQDSLRALHRKIQGLLTRPASPQTSTSTSAPPNPKATGWDVDRVRFKNWPCFSVPVKFLLMPGDGPEQRPHSRSRDDRTPESLESPESPEGPQSPETRRSPQVHRSPETHQRPLTKQSPETRQSPRARPDAETPRSSEDAHWRRGMVEPQRFSEDLLQESSLLRCALPRIMGGPARLAANQWDLFPPPCETSSSTDASGDDSPRPGPSGLPARVSQPSDLPPYQALSSVIDTPAGPAETQAPSSVQDPPAHLDPEEEQMDRGDAPVEGLRRRSEETLAGTGPPTWICETPDRTAAEGGREQAPRVRPVSSQGTPQDIDDFSWFQVSDSLQRWAVQYLLPKPL